MLKYEIEGKRVLELGCGMALSSLLINRRGGDITATDYHPEAGAFLHANTLLNEDAEIPYFRANWNEDESTHGRFGLIVGSDILYEHDQLTPLARFIDGHALPQCEVVVVDPGRKQQGQFSQRMLKHGFSQHRGSAQDITNLEKPFKGSILTYRR